MTCYFYILQNQHDFSFYIGHTCDDINERIAKHNRPHKGYINSKRPWKIVYSEIYQSKHEALNREKQVKAWKNRKKLQDLINQGSSVG